MYKIKLKSDDAFGVFYAEFPHNMGDLLASTTRVHDGPITFEVEYIEDKKKQEAEKDVAE